MGGRFQSERTSIINEVLEPHVWKHVCNFCSDTPKKDRLFYSKSSQAVKHKFVTVNLLANVKARSGNTCFTRDNETRKFVFCK
jgi:hypothetical protein